MLAGSGVNWYGLELVAAPKVAGKNIGQIITIILPYIFMVAGLLMLGYLIYSGFQYMFSQGDPKAMQVAKVNITYAIIGFLVVFISYWAVAIMANILGLQTIIKIF